MAWGPEQSEAGMNWVYVLRLSKYRKTRKAQSLRKSFERRPSGGRADAERGSVSRKPAALIERAKRRRCRGWIGKRVLATSKMARRVIPSDESCSQNCWHIPSMDAGSALPNSAIQTSTSMSNPGIISTGIRSTKDMRSPTRNEKWSKNEWKETNLSLPI